MSHHTHSVSQTTSVNQQFTATTIHIFYAGIHYFQETTNIL